jgi:hypothetical protein
MRYWKFFLLGLIGLSGCSDLGTGPSGNWTEYDLPYAQIYLPTELVRQTSVASLPQNPIFSGTVIGQPLLVELCIYTTPSRSDFIDYEEQAITIQGVHAVIFHGRGFLHPYDSHISTMVGMKGYFRPDGGPVVVMVTVTSPEAEELARGILFTLHPQPNNTGNPL